VYVLKKHTMYREVCILTDWCYYLNLVSLFALGECLSQVWLW